MFFAVPPDYDSFHARSLGVGQNGNVFLALTHFCRVRGVWKSRCDQLKICLLCVAEFLGTRKRGELP